MKRRLTVVISKGQSNHPEKRSLEESVASNLVAESDIDVVVVPNLYDVQPKGEAVAALRKLDGDLVVFTWLYPRAAHWMMDRFGILGHVGESLLAADDSDDDDDDDWKDEADDKDRVAASREFPDRRIYCIDLRSANEPQAFIDETLRIRQESQSRRFEHGGNGNGNGNGNGTTLDHWLGGDGSSAQKARFENPTNDTRLDAHGKLETPLPFDLSGGNLRRVDEQAGRRWYPVIDFSRCTNCMECIDFCLFGVYGVDGSETILVEQPDNCRKGCPACSRVCPENAIIFPQHKTPAIAGAEVAVGGLKIDLSKLFGAPETNEDAADVAARERDEQLLLAGREAVGMSVGIPKRHTESDSNAPKDKLDNLIDALDELDL